MFTFTTICKTETKRVPKKLCVYHFIRLKMVWNQIQCKGKIKKNLLALHFSICSLNESIHENAYEERICLTSKLKKIKDNNYHKQAFWNLYIGRFVYHTWTGLEKKIQSYYIIYFFNQFCNQVSRPLALALWANENENLLDQKENLIVPHDWMTIFSSPNVYTTQNLYTV